MNKDYTWKTPEEVIDLLLTVPDGTSVDFTFDTPEDECDNFKPSGWYGIKKVIIFGDYCLCMGKYGGGDTRIEVIRDHNYLKDFYDFIEDKNGFIGNKDNFVLCVSNKYNGA